MIAALTFGLAPSLQASRAALSGGLSEQGRGGELGRRRRVIAKGLVVGQLALALVLLGGAGSLMRAFQSVANADPGFDPEGLLVFTETFQSAGISPKTLRPMSPSGWRRRFGRFPG